LVVSYFRLVLVLSFFYLVPHRVQREIFLCRSPFKET